MENLLELLRERGGIFNVKFHKADGTLRSMNARFGRTATSLIEQGIINK